MMADHLIVFAVLASAMVLFVWGRWRYDVVAFTALVVAVLAGVVPVAGAFSGFGHPAVITVAAVLVISRALQKSGVIDYVADRLMATAGNDLLHIGALTVLAAVLSAFMNNVGALALLMPVALQTASKSEISPARLLMPLSFASILGGLMTLIGTPPNIIVATYRHGVAGAPFAMFDFSPVGVIVAVAGVAFVVLVGWRLIPHERRGRRAPEDAFEVGDYVTEARITEDSKLIGKSVRQLEILADDEVAVIGLVRDERRFLGNVRQARLRPGDVVTIQADPVDLQKAIKAGGLELVGEERLDPEALRSDEVGVVEAVIMPGSRIEGLTARMLHLRRQYGVNLLAVARQGKAFKRRLHHVRFRPGDVLLLQGDVDTLAETVAALDCLPLAQRGLHLGKRPQAFVPLLAFGVALGLTAAGVLPVHVAFAAAVAVLVVVEVVSPREVYESIDWPVIVLLGAMIPLGRALETSGGTDLIATAILGAAGNVHPIVVTALLLIVTMTLSDVMNNAATAVVMAPIAASLAGQLGVNADPFLMTVAVGASCAFLTPIGHQNNVLVMGPGGYRFGDYWRMGLPLEILIVVIAVPTISWMWPY